MSPSLVLQLGLLHFLCAPTPAIISPKVQNYTITAIEYLSRHQPGRFECVFFDGTDRGTYFDPDFEQLIRSPRLEHVAKYVINSSTLLSHNTGGLPRAPSLVVINVHGDLVDISTDQLEISPHTRIIVLFEMECVGCTYSVVMSLIFYSLTTQFTRIVCVESTDMFFVRTGFNGTFDKFFDYLEPSELFPNLLHDMQGRTIRYSASARIDLKQESWMKETARYLNATSRYVRAPCDHTLGRLSDCFHRFFMSGTVIISLDCESHKKLITNSQRALFGVIPYTNAFVIPMPRKINVLEMFFWPFTVAAWIVLTVIVMSLEIINLVYPSLFKNNPTLLIICGFERYDLHRSSVREKLIFLSLIIFFFVMINAYETRIISFMIEKPSIRMIKTVRELIDSELTIKADKIRSLDLFNDTKFNGKLLDSSDHQVDNLDGKNAYYSEANYMEQRIRMPINFNFKKRRPNYYILPETERMNICLYWLPWYDSLMEFFGFTERAFFETGLLAKWMEDDNDAVNLRQKRWLLSTGLDLLEEEDRLDFGDMLPAWMAIGVGLVVSLVVFFGELINSCLIARIKRRCGKSRTVRGTTWT
ncbi:hypothetical protein RP20_CCG002596 [Aedes albopictus]|nr:hypothetical protein RP20_CCG002596 [Aedes albopictus]